jgi:hypothetical protein
MRYGVWLNYPTEDAALAERDRISRNDIFTFSWAKTAIQDIVTLHGEVAHEKREKEVWRDRAIIAERKLADAERPPPDKTWTSTELELRHRRAPGEQR